MQSYFDTIPHDRLVARLEERIIDGGVLDLIRGWLQADILKGLERWTPTQGSPQGAVISPLLANIYLDPLDKLMATKGYRMVRYADDFVVFCESREDAIAVKDRILPEWLAERGLSLSEEKTRIVHLTDGFDFLGFNVRHYRAPRTTRSGYKLLIRPSKKSVTGLREKLRDVWLRQRGRRVRAALFALNPIARGWANYFRTAVASATFKKLDYWMYRRAVRYARHTHPKKPWRWLVSRYWGRLNPDRNDVWVFGDKHTGQYLLRFGWFKIARHALVRGTSSPDDASLREYWWARQRVNTRHLSISDVRLAEAQDWYCPVCGGDLINGEPLERHHREPKSEGGSDSSGNRELVHQLCHQQLTAAWRESRRSGLDPRRE